MSNDGKFFCVRCGTDKDKKLSSPDEELCNPCFEESQGA